MGKMTAELVQEMRRAYGEGATQGALARHYQLGIAQVGRIVRGECWQKGSGLRMPTQAEQDRTLEKLLTLQEQVKAREAWEVEHGGEAAEVLGVKRAPPPMLTEGGDAPSEVDGSAFGRLQEVAEHDGLDIDKALQNPLTAPGGAYDFINRKGT